MWDTFIINPMLNGLLFLYSILGHNFTIAIVVFTLLIKLITLPLTFQQQKSTKAMQDLTQSKDYQEMQKKYAKDKEKLAQEQMRMYKAAGVNPFGSCLPMLIQFPVLIGLYQSIIRALAHTPVALLELSQHIYPFFPNFSQLIPLQNTFLWMRLGQPDPYYVLPVLVVATTYLQQKLVTPPSTADSQSAQMTQSMAVTMPLMFGFFSLSFASGLSIYFIVSNLLTMVQYAVMPGANINWRNLLSFSSPPPAKPAGKPIAKAGKGKAGADNADGKGGAMGEAHKGGAKSEKPARK